MTYQVLARKWRPQQFDDVIGQDHVTRTLKNAIAENRVAHAYLFVGPRGTGKTSTARIFAKALNCEKGPTPAPCDQCDACLEIMNNTAMDVMEIDAASNTGVDHVRELRENARYTPVRGPYKIYVIDEVHMLSPGAFNALLKTLEEPPAHVKFVLATTDPQKVPPTIHSRCQRFDLRRISTTVIADSIGRIARAEDVDIDEDALLAIARGAEGGMRDAQSALDQLISFIGRKIREPDVLSVFGLVSRRALEELAAAVLEGDIPRILERIAELDEGGKDMQRLVIELLEYFRNVLICLHAPDSAAALDITEVQRTQLKEQADKTDAGRVLQVVQLLTDAENRLRYALSRRTLVETALIRAARAATVMSIDELLKELNSVKESLGGTAAPQPSVVAPEPAKKKSRDAGPVAATPDAETKPEDSEAAPEPKAKATTPTVNRETLLADHQRIFGHWHDLSEQAGHIAPLVRNYLVDAKPLAVDADHVTIGFDPEFTSSMENIDVPRNRSALQKVLSRFLHRDVSVRFRVMEASDTLPGDIKLPERKDTNTGNDIRALPPEALTAEQRWVQDPVVRRTLETFNGEIIDIRE